MQQRIGSDTICKGDATKGNGSLCRGKAKYSTAKSRNTQQWQDKTFTRGIAEGCEGKEKKVIWMSSYFLGAAISVLIAFSRMRMEPISKRIPVIVLDIVIYTALWLLLTGML